MPHVPIFLAGIALFGSCVYWGLNREAPVSEMYSIMAVAIFLYAALICKISNFIQENIQAICLTSTMGPTALTARQQAIQSCIPPTCIGASFGIAVLIVVYSILQDSYESRYLTQMLVGTGYFGGVLLITYATASFNHMLAVFNNEKPEHPLGFKGLFKVFKVNYYLISLALLSAAYAYASRDIPMELQNIEGALGKIESVTKTYLAQTAPQLKPTCKECFHEEIEAAWKDIEKDIVENHKLFADICTHSHYNSNEMALTQYTFKQSNTPLIYTIEASCGLHKTATKAHIKVYSETQGYKRVIDTISYNQNFVNK